MVKIECTLFPIGLGESRNQETCGAHASRAPKVVLDLLKNKNGRVIGFEVKPETDSDYAHYWCASLLHGLRGCNFGAHIMLAGKPPNKCWAFIDNEMVDGGRLCWQIPADLFEDFREAICPMHIDAKLDSYLTHRLGGTDELPFFDGFQIVNGDIVTQIAEAGLDEAIRRTSTLSSH